ncbi:MAG TPA: YceI family protein [Kofleriaceae bacterium]|jgi:polyisoprenoid-binding protein YceI
MSTNRPSRALLAPIAIVLASLIASLVRWYLQGSFNIYTALHKRFYVRDPDLGWRVSVQHPIWLGLEICAVLLGLAIALAIGVVIIRRREVRIDGRATLLRGASWLVALATLVVPTAAFISGPGALHGRDTLPPTNAVQFEDGIEGALDAPSGAYTVVEHPGTSVTAHLSAGGEAFDARFGGIAGTWTGDPHELNAAMHADISVATASVDTGIGERSKHAREGYLHAEKYPRINVTIDRAAAVRANGANVIAFRAPGTVSLLGKTHIVDVTGTVTKLDAAALARQGLTGDVLLVQADLALSIKTTALAPDAGDFDGDRLPIHVSLVLRRN